MGGVVVNLVRRFRPPKVANALGLNVMTMGKEPQNRRPQKGEGDVLVVTA
jgi:hypothetical protein